MSEGSASAHDVQIIDPGEDGAWDALVATHPEANVFHSSAWARVLVKTYGHRPIYLRFSQAGATTALVPLMEVSSPITGRRGLSIPFADACSPLFFGDGSREFVGQHLVSLARERGWKYLEVRGLFAQASPACTFYNHTLDLTESIERLHENLEGAVRRNLRKAERSGMTLHFGAGRHDLMEFYRLHERTRRRHGAPPQPIEFFRQIERHLLRRGLGFVVLAKLQSRVIAGAVFFQSGAHALYKFGASDVRDQELRANNLVMWEGIQALVARGATTLDFGRTAPDNDGLRRFKLGWGSEEKMLTYTRLEPRTGEWTALPAPSSGGAVATAVRKFPLSINRILGKICYPHLD